MKELIINFTPTGMIPTKETTHYVPIFPNEIIEEVHLAYELGITMVHLHARDEKTGKPTYKQLSFAKILQGIRQHCPDLVVCTSLSGRNINELDKRMEPLQCYPDMGSFTLSSLNFSKLASLNSPAMIQQMARTMNDLGVKPECALFDYGMLNYAKYLIQKKLLKPPYYFNIIVGNIAGIQCDMAHIGALIKELPEMSYWSLGGIGQTQLQSNTLAIATGGGVRVGLEDNIYFDGRKTILASNIDLLKRIHHLADIFERPLMPAKKFGDLGFYNINQVNKNYETLHPVRA